MQKALAAHVDAHMALAEAGLEKHQVAGLQFGTVHALPFPGQLLGGARQVHAELGPEGDLHEGGTIHAGLTAAAKPVRHAAPALRLGAQQRQHRRALAPGALGGHVVAQQRRRLAAGGTLFHMRRRAAGAADKQRRQYQKHWQ